MKKRFLFFMMISFPALCYCQLWNLIGKETENDKVRIGIKLGLAFSNVQVEYGDNLNTEVEKNSSHTGLISGFYLNMDLNKKLRFQPALLLISKGMNENHQSFTIRKNLSYVEVQLNLLHQSNSAKGSFFIGGGLAPSYYTGETLFYSGNNDLKKLDVGINFLTGYEIPIGFSLNLNYTHGLVNVSGVREYMPVFRNRSFGIAVGYTF